VAGLEATLDATLDGGRARGTLDASQESTRLAATFALPLDGEGAIELRTRVQGLDLARAARLGGVDGEFAGTVEGDLGVTGTFARPEATVRIAGATLRFAGIEAAAATLEATSSGPLERPRGQGRLLVRGLAASGRPPVDADLAFDAGAAKTSLTAVARLGNVELGTASLAIAAAPEALARSWETAPLEGRVDAAAVDVALLARLLGLEATLGGKASLAASFGGTAAAPTVRLAVRGDELRLDRNPLGRLAVEGTYAQKALAVEAMVEGASGGNARLAGKWTADLGAAGIRGGAVAALADAPVDLAFVANRFDLAFLEPLSPDVRQLEGRVDADLRIRGKAPTPDLQGTFELTDGRLGYTNLGDLRDLSLAVTFAPDRFTLRRLTASSGGTFEAAGEAVRRERGGPYQLDLKLVARRFGIVGSDVTRAWLDADGRLTGTIEGAKLDGTLELSRGEVRLPNTPSKSIQALDDHPDFVMVRRGEDREAARTRAAREAAPVAKAPSPWDEAEASLQVKTKRPLAVEGADVSLLATVDLRARATRGAFNLAGRVETTGGHVVVMNRRFDVERGRVIYGGRETPGNPRLDVVAAHASTYARVTVHISGDVEEPVMGLRSEPPMSEAEIATLLATGRPQLKRGGGGVSEASGAASAIGALMSDQLKKGIAAKLPVDVLNFQAGEEGVFEGSTLEAGSYVTDRIYVGYQRTFTEEENPRRNQNEVRVEYQLAPRWTLESSYGDHAAGGVDLFWTRDF
jgi:translocation and assembly module TamB